MLAELPVLPIYTYANNTLIKPYVRGLYPSATDQHPLTAVWIDRDWNRAARRRETKP